MREELIKAIGCCRKSDCEHCPLQRDICDELDVLMESIPVELLNMIEDELETNHDEISDNGMSVKQGA